MSTALSVALRTLKASLPALAFVGGLVSLAVLAGSGTAPNRWLTSGVAAICLLAMSAMLQSQRRMINEMRQSLGHLREEMITRRSTMRFIFDELLDDPEAVYARGIRTRYLLQTSLNEASGFLDLMGEWQPAVEPATGNAYLRAARRALVRSSELVADLGKKNATPSLHASEILGSVNRKVVSAGDRAYSD